MSAAWRAHGVVKVLPFAVPATSQCLATHPLTAAYAPPRTPRELTHRHIGALTSSGYHRRRPPPTTSAHTVRTDNHAPATIECPKHAAQPRGLDTFTRILTPCLRAERTWYVRHAPLAQHMGGSRQRVIGRPIEAPSSPTPPSMLAPCSCPSRIRRTPSKPRFPIHHLDLRNDVAGDIGACTGPLSPGGTPLVCRAPCLSPCGLTDITGTAPSCERCRRSRPHQCRGPPSHSNEGLGDPTATSSAAAATAMANLEY